MYSGLDGSGGPRRRLVTDFDILSAAGRDMPHAVYFDRMRPVIPHPDTCDSGPGGYCIQEEIDAARSMQPFTPSQNLGPPAVATIIGPSVWREV